MRSTYLRFLHDLSTARQYSWGGAALAVLYRQLCVAASDATVRDIAGPLLLLQLWAFERMLYISPTPRRQPAQPGDGDLRGPRGFRWIGSHSHRHVTTHVLRTFRDQLDQQQPGQFRWMPYDEDEAWAELPSYCTAGAGVWMAEVPLICFEIVEWHLPQRVMRQFGMRQDIPRYRDTEVGLHGISRSGKVGIDWSARHERYLRRWRRRLHYVIRADPQHPADISREYRSWYWRVTRRIINPPDTAGLPRHQPAAGIMETQVFSICLRSLFR